MVIRRVLLTHKFDDSTPSSRTDRKGASDRLLDSFTDQSLARLEQERVNHDGQAIGDPNYASLTDLTRAMDDPRAIADIFQDMTHRLQPKNEQAGEFQSGRREQHPIISFGGMRLIVRAMAVAHANERVQATGCNLLGALAACCNTARNQISDLEGVEVIGDAMSNFEKSASLNEGAINAAAQLAGMDETRAMSNAKKLVPTIVTAMKNIHDPTLQESAACAISALCRGAPQVQQQAGRDGAVESLLGTLKRFPNLTSVQAQCYSTLGDMVSDCEYNQQLIGEVGGVPVILGAIEKFTGAPDVQENAAAALANITTQSANATEVAAAGGVEVCIEYFMNHDSDSRMLEHIINTFKNVVVHAGEFPIEAFRHPDRKHGSGDSQEKVEKLQNDLDKATRTILEMTGMEQQRVEAARIAENAKTDVWWNIKPGHSWIGKADKVEGIRAASGNEDASSESVVAKVDRRSVTDGEPGVGLRVSSGDGEVQEGSGEADCGSSPKVGEVAAPPPVSQCRIT